MGTQGIITLTIWLLTPTVLILANKPIRKVLKMELFWKILMPLFVAYFIYARIWDYWSNGKLDQFDIFLDFCPFGGFAVPILAFFKKTRKIAQYYAVWIMIGSGVTAFQLFTSETSGSYLKWFFYSEPFHDYGKPYFSENTTPFYNFLHFFTFNLGILLLFTLNIRKLNWTYALGNSMAMILYLAYVYVAKTIAGFDHNITGLGSYDWEYGEYSAVGEMFNMTYPTVFWFSFSLLAFVNWGAVGLTFLYKKTYLKHKWNNWFI